MLNSKELQDWMEHEREETAETVAPAVDGQSRAADPAPRAKPRAEDAAVQVAAAVQPIAADRRRQRPPGLSTAARLGLFAVAAIVAGVVVALLS